MNRCSRVFAKGRDALIWFRLRMFYKPFSAPKPLHAPPNQRAVSCNTLKHFNNSGWRRRRQAATAAAHTQTFSPKMRAPKPRFLILLPPLTQQPAEARPPPPHHPQWAVLQCAPLPCYHSLQYPCSPSTCAGENRCTRSSPSTTSTLPQPQPAACTPHCITQPPPHTHTHTPNSPQIRLLGRRERRCCWRLRGRWG